MRVRVRVRVRVTVPPLQKPGLGWLSRPAG